MKTPKEIIEKHGWHMGCEFNYYDVVNLMIEYRSQFAIPKTSDELDLIQYVTNLLYAAYHKGGRDNTCIDDFKKWVSEKTGELSEYCKSVK